MQWGTVQNMSLALKAISDDMRVLKIDPTMESYTLLIPGYPA